MTKFKTRNSVQSGFTLVEVVVAVFVFLTAIIIASGTFVSAISLQRRALNMKKVEENGRFILEMMAREIRFANPIYAPDRFFSSEDFNFEHPVNGQVEYSLRDKKARRYAVTQGADTFISSPDVEVTRMLFYISGNTANDDKQPRVTIILSLRAGGSSREAATIDLQTTVTQRVLSD